MKNGTTYAASDADSQNRQRFRAFERVVEVIVLVVALTAWVLLTEMVSECRVSGNRVCEWSLIGASWAGGAILVGVLMIVDAAGKKIK